MGLGGFRFFFKLGVLLLELFNPAGGVHQLLGSGEEGVAGRTDFDGEILGNGGKSFNLISTSAGDANRVQDGMNVFLHKFC